MKIEVIMKVDWREEVFEFSDIEDAVQFMKIAKDAHRKENEDSKVSFKLLVYFDETQEGDDF